MLLCRFNGFLAPAFSRNRIESVSVYINFGPIWIKSPHGSLLESCHKLGLSEWTIQQGMIRDLNWLHDIILMITKHLVD